MFKTKSELEQATTPELLQATLEAANHTATMKSILDTNKGKSFEELPDTIKSKCFRYYFGVDYEYSIITNELKKRNCVNRWIDPSAQDTPKTVASAKSIVVGFDSDNNARMNLNMTQECKTRYEKFLADKSYNFVHTTAALMSYMDDVEAKKIKVAVKVV